MRLTITRHEPIWRTRSIKVEVASLDIAIETAESLVDEASCAGDDEVDDGDPVENIESELTISDESGTQLYPAAEPTETRVEVTSQRRAVKLQPPGAYTFAVGFRGMDNVTVRTDTAMPMDELKGRAHTQWKEGDLNEHGNEWQAMTTIVLDRFTPSEATNAENTKPTDRDPGEPW